MRRSISCIPRGDFDWIWTASGRKFWPLDPRPEEIFIEDVASHLSKICRFLGACEPEYSVAEHSVRVAHLVERELRRLGRAEKEIRRLTLDGLLHDASEAYLCDLARPTKGSAQLGRLYRGHEAGIMRAVAQRFGVSDAKPSVVAWADDVLLVTEFRDLMPPGCEVNRPANVVPLPDRIVPFSTASDARNAFLAAFQRLTDGGADGREWREFPERAS